MSVTSRPSAARGANAVELATRHPTGSDGGRQESVVRLAAAGSRTRTCAGGCIPRGDLHADPLPTGADVIMFFHLFEIWSLEREHRAAAQVLRRRFPRGASDTGLQLRVQRRRHRVDECRLMSPYFLTWLGGGMAYSPAAWSMAVLDAGFSTVERCFRTWVSATRCHRVQVGRPTSSGRRTIMSTTTSSPNVAAQILASAGVAEDWSYYGPVCQR